MNENLIKTGIVCICVMECFALYMGHDGVLLTSAIAAVTGLVCWRIPVKNG